MNKLLIHNVLALIKLGVLILITIIGILLMIGESMNDELSCEIISKMLGTSLLYIAYKIFNGGFKNDMN